MKRITIIIAFMLCVMMLFACTNDEGNSNNTNKTADTKASDTETADTEVTDRVSDEWCVRGNVNDGVYKSEWADVSFTIPADMMVFDDEQTNMLMGEGNNLIDSDGKKLFDIKSMDLVYDLCALSESNDMLFVTLHKNLTCKDYISQLKSDMNEPGLEFEEKNVSLGGIEFSCLEVVFTTEYFTIYQTYLMKEVDGNLFCISIGSENTVVTDSLFDSISAS